MKLDFGLASAALTAATVLVALSADAQGTQTGVMRFPETISPDGAYALAWGEEVEGLQDGDRREVPRETQFDLDTTISDFLIDARLGRVLLMIPEWEYYSGPQGQRNHSSLSVAWSPDSHGVIANLDGRYSSKAVLWIDVEKRTITDLQKSLDRLLRQSARANHSKAEVARREGVVFSHWAVLKPGVLVVNATLSGFLSKFEQVDDFTYRLKVRFRISNDRPEVKLVKSKEIGEEDYEGMNKGDAALELALNRVYAKLRAKLPATPKEVLKQEQVRWLKQRDELPEEWHKESFTRQRVDYLRARLEE